MKTRQFLLIGFLLLLGSSQALLAQTHSIKIKSGIRNEPLHLVVATKVDGAIVVLKSLSLVNFGDYENLEVSATDQLLLVANTAQMGMDEGAVIDESDRDKMQVFTIAEMRSFTLAVTKSEDGEYHYQATNVDWGN